jgi:hypothetical protein
MKPDAKNSPPAPDDYGTTVFSNAVRLNGREWLFVAGCTALLFLLPTLWQRLERLALEQDYRLPHEMGNDYWLYERVARLAVEQYDTVLIGDSVVWGEYVLGPGTLSHYLNEQEGQERCANLGLDGAHPLALSGLVEHYAGAIAGKNVVLQCNPLWLTSPKADLQDPKADINHPRLIPQFTVHIPAYDDKREEEKVQISDRIGVLVEQRVPLSSWTAHLQQAYYGQTDIPSWTLEHPYENPLQFWPPRLPPPDRSLRHTPQPWYKSGIAPQDYPWVEPEKSLQWAAFQRVVELLQKRGNRVFVLVGPFNEHLLKPESLRRYELVKATIVEWLRAQRIPHFAPSPLPSELYGDASHPLAAGYARLARQLHGKLSFTPKPNER